METNSLGAIAVALFIIVPGACRVTRVPVLDPPCALFPSNRDAPLA